MYTDQFKATALSVESECGSASYEVSWSTATIDVFSANTGGADKVYSRNKYPAAVLFSK